MANIVNVWSYNTPVCGVPSLANRSRLIDLVLSGYVTEHTFCFSLDTYNMYVQDGTSCTDYHTVHTPYISVPNVRVCGTISCPTRVNVFPHLIFGSHHKRTQALIFNTDRRSTQQPEACFNLFQHSPAINHGCPQSQSLCR